MNIDWKSRLQSKTFWVSMISAVILLAQQLGLQLPANIADVCNTILTIAVILGIIIDPSTPGVSDCKVYKAQSIDELLEKTESPKDK